MRNVSVNKAVARQHNDQEKKKLFLGCSFNLLKSKDTLKRMQRESDPSNIWLIKSKRANTRGKTGSKF